MKAQGAIAPFAPNTFSGGCAPKTDQVLGFFPVVLSSIKPFRSLFGLPRSPTSAWV